MPNPVEMSFKEWLALEEKARRANYVAYRSYYEGDHPTQLTDRQKKYLELKSDARFCANYCQVVVDALAERLSVTGFVCENKQAQPLVADWWRLNRMDEIQGNVHTATVRDGDSFVMVDWDNDEGLPRFTQHLANDGTYGVQMTYDDDGQTVLFASKRWVTVLGANAGKQRRLNLYFADRIERYVSNDDQDAGDWQPYQTEGEAWPVPWADPSGQPLGVPIIHFRNKCAGETHGLSELANVIPLQDALNKALIDLIAAFDTTAFQMLYVIGFDPGVSTLGPGSILWNENENGQVGVLPASDMAGLRGGLADIVVQIAGVSRTPQYYFQGLGEPPSGESLKSQETGLVSKARDRQVRFGNAWEDVLKMALALQTAFGQGAAEAGHIEAQWRDPETRNEEAHTRALKLKAELGIPTRQLWSEMGYNDEQNEKMEAEQAEAEAERQTLGAMLLERFETAGKPEESEEDEES